MAHKHMARLHLGTDFQLLAAAENGDQELVKALIHEFPSDINRRTQEGWSPLILACKEGHVVVAEMLLCAGANPNPPEVAHTALRAAALYGHIQCIQLLLEYQANPNILSMGSKNALMGASMNGYPDCVQALLEHGASTDTVNDFGETALALAEAKGHETCANLLRAWMSKQHGQHNSPPT